jgi:hypothetical protein
MLVLRLELWPHGDPTKAQTLGILHVINDGTGDVKKGNYNIRAWGKRLNGKPWKTGHINNWPRLRYHGWHLIKECLNSILG